MIHYIRIFNTALPFLYIITFSLYAYDFFKGGEKFANSKRLSLFLTLVMHCSYLILRTVEFNHVPITNVFEIFTLLACTVSFSYFVLELLTDIRGTGLFILFLSIVFQIISTLFVQDLHEVKEVLRNNLLGLHVVSAMLGYSGIAISAVYGFLYYMLYNEIKSSNFGLMYERLPNLEILERLSFVAAIIGYVLLTVAIIMGAWWLPQAFPNYSRFDPKLVITTFIWIMYGAGIISKLLGKLQGKRAIIFTMIGFVLAMVSIAVSNFLADSFHSFYK